MEPTTNNRDQLIERAEPRSNVFLAALMDGPGGALPVRLRNLSPRGALLEGPVIRLEGKFAFAGAIFTSLERSLGCEVAIAGCNSIL